MTEYCHRLYSWPLAAFAGVFALAASACMTSDVATSESSNGAATDGRLRIVAANLTSGNNQSYDPGHGARILDGLDPDIVLIQEFNVGDNTATELSAWVQDHFGAGYTYFVEPVGQIPNGVISRYPIVEAGEWSDPEVSNRDFVYARIDIPGDRDLWAVSVHFLTANAGVRQDEAEEVVRRILDEVPDNDLLVFGGDLNTNSRGEAALDTLSAVVVTGGPFPVDQQGNGNTNRNRNDPYDHVLADADLQALAVPAVIGSSEFAAGAVIDTRIYQPLSDIAPAQQGDSGASNMQHMAVVKDFVIPVLGEPDAAPPAPDAAPPAPDAAPCPAPDAATPDAAAPDAGPSEIPTAMLVINEVLANEPGGDTAGEFVELVNAGGEAADLLGLTLEDGSAVRHQFGPITLAPGSRIVVYAGAEAIPAGVDNAVAASSGRLSLANGGDTVTLADSLGVLDTTTYAGALADEDGVSMNRSLDGDPSAPFVLHTALSAAPSSPGTAP